MMKTWNMGKPHDFSSSALHLIRPTASRMVRELSPLALAVLRRNNYKSSTDLEVLISEAF
jgi:hypothetical protein